MAMHIDDRALLRNDGELLHILLDRLKRQ